MRKNLFTLILMLLGVLQLPAQITRSDEFHQKYTLSEVVVFSRHNIRAPMAGPGSLLEQVTPYEWHDFGVNTQELTMKGGILETTNGQFFHKWVVSEGLFPENAEPTSDELYVLANSKQRTISTARHFVSAFMPMQTVTVHHEGKIGDSDPNFTLNLGTDLTESDLAQIKAEYAAAYTPEALRQLSESLQPIYDLLADVIDLKDSEGYKTGTFMGFDNHDTTIEYAIGTEPSLTASISDAATIVDALVLQYYEEPDALKAGFGHELTLQQWHDLASLIHVRDHVRFSSPFVNRYVSRHQRQIIADELLNSGRKFTFLCGHDTNILNILAALRMKSYETPEAIESGTPIGSKIVFEKWTDEGGQQFVAVNHVYQSLDELRNNTLLNLDTPPNIIPLEFEDMTANEDGLYTLDDMIGRLTDSDNPEPVSSIRSEASTQAPAYTLQGTLAPSDYRGIILRDGQKNIVR